MTVVYFIIVLGVLIFAHELGHFLVAKAIGVRVLKFSLGFGPRLIGKKVGDTDYMISAFPLGGYVKLLGDNPEDEIPKEERAISFLSQKNWKKISIAAAGPIFNILLAVMALWIVFMRGVPIPDPVVGNVIDGYPAKAAGILVGDTIVAINNKPIDNWEDMAKEIEASDGEDLKVMVRRNGEELNFVIKPIIGETTDRFLSPKKTYMIGIGQSDSYHIVQYSPLPAFIEGAKATGIIVKLTYQAIGKMFTGAISIDNIGGPILIAKISREAAEEGIATFLGFIGLISINLGILNLLPVPVLDGGHILFFTIEAIIRKPISIKIKEVALQIGLTLLVILMALAFYFDILRLIFTPDQLP